MVQRNNTRRRRLPLPSSRMMKVGLNLVLLIGALSMHLVAVLFPSMPMTIQEDLPDPLSTPTTTSAPPKSDVPITPPQVKKRPLDDDKLKERENFDPLLRYLRQQVDNRGNRQLHNASSYQQQHCYLRNDMEWCPTSPNDGWMQRTPRFMVIGEKKAGTTSMFQSLVRHKNIVAGQDKELLFFTQVRFNTTKYGIRKSDSNSRFDYKIDVQKARQDYQKLFPLERLQQNSSLISLDASPEYLFNFGTSAKSILCTHPWIKLIVTLRNPTLRLFSQHHFVKNVVMRKNPNKEFITTFEETIQTNLKKLQQLGLIQSDGSGSENSENNPALTKAQLDEAWYDYRKKQPEGQVGRGIYALTLNEWFQELRSMGRDPRDSVRIVRLEDLKRGGPIAAQILNELVEWVLQDVVKDDDGNSNVNTANTTTVDYLQAFRHVMKTNYTKLGNPTLSKETKQLLDDFYAPYNGMLAKLLGDERWNYRSTNTDDDDAPLVWPPNSSKDSKKLFAPGGGDTKGPCGS